jgi:hypothetical protein
MSCGKRPGCRAHRHMHLREGPEGLGSLVACLLNRQADVCKEMVFSISQFAELTSLAVAFDPDLDSRRQLREKERHKPRSS